MGKRVLITCCTPYQLLVAAQVLYAYYPDCQADLIVTDQMSGSRKVFEACGIPAGLAMCTIWRRSA